MNMLIDALPDSVTVEGLNVRVNTDFRYTLRVYAAFDDNLLTPQEKQIILLANLYAEIPQNVAEALNQADWFINGGQSTKEEESGPRLFSFRKDASLIYAAFMQTHGIDLSSASLHWWQFLALFMDLGQDTFFCRLVALRKRVKTGRATKEEREAAREMGDLFDVPELDDRTLEEKVVAERFEKQIAEAQRMRQANG